MSATRRWAIALAALTLAATACATSATEEADEPAPTTTTQEQDGGAMDEGSMDDQSADEASKDDMSSMDEGTMDHDHSHHDHDGHAMGDASLPAAYTRDGATIASGEFASLPGATPSGIGGMAWLARHADGTTVTLELTGLDPSTDHIAHVHERPCAEAGGPHYRHDPDGGPNPPNEIHLAFTTDASGMGMMTVDNPEVANDDAVSVVVHAAAEGAPKLACADLSG